MQHSLRSTLAIRFTLLILAEVVIGDTCCQTVCDALLEAWNPSEWKVEKGSYAVEIGSSSEDIRLNGEFCIQKNTYVQGRNRGFYAKAVVE